jgi:hypothetical protein
LLIFLRLLERRPPYTMPASLEAQQLLPPPSLREILSAYSSSSPANSSHTSRSALLDLLAEKTSEDERIAHAYCDYGSKAAALLGTRQQALSTATEESQAAGAAPVSRGLESSSSRAKSAFSSSSSRGKRLTPPSREESGPGRRSEKRLRKEATSSSSSSAHHPALSRSHSHNLSSSVQLPSSLSIDFSSHLSLPIPDPASQSAVSLPWTSSFFSYTTVPLSSSLSTSSSSSKALPSPYQLPPLLTISPSSQSSTSSPNPSQAISYFPRPSYSASSSYSADPTSSSIGTTEKNSLLPSPASPNPPPRTDLPPLRQSLPYFSSSSVLHPQHPSDLQQNPPTNARRERPMAPPLLGYTPRPGADRSSSVEARGRLTLESLARVTIGGSSTEKTEGASTRRE